MKIYNCLKIIFYTCRSPAEFQAPRAKRKGIERNELRIHLIHGLIAFII